MTKTKNKQVWAFFGIGCGFLVIILIAAAGVYLYAGWLGYNESPMMVEVQDNTSQLAAPYTLSSAQKEKLLNIGYPEAFTILFYEEKSIGGEIQTVRLETWDYYNLGVGLVFINGDLIAEDPLEVEIIGFLDPLPYFPEQFSAFMSLDDVVASAGLETYAEIPLDKNFLDGGVSYFADSLTFGLKNDELFYIEALAVSSE